MAGETDLNLLLSSMRAILIEGVYVFVTLANQEMPAEIIPRMIFQESEGTTYILHKSDAIFAGLHYEFPCRMITLDVHSSLDAVGFIARIATELAKADMGVNPVSGFYHDHLFVPDGQEDKAMSILQKLADEAA